MLYARWIIIFAGTALVGLPTTTADPSLGVPEPVGSMGRSKIVLKSVFSDKFRMVFTAGLEGSGHHYFVSAAEAVFRANSELPSIHRHMDSKPFYLPVLMGERASHYDGARLLATAAMKKLAVEAAGFSRPTFYLPHHRSSYPSNGGPGKVMQYDDLRLVAQAAELGGIDLRVVYLKRSAEELIIANTVHKQYHILDHHQTEKSEEEVFLEYVRILFTNMAVLHSFLGEIDPGFIVCHDWNSLGEPLQASKIAAFVSPNKEVAGMISTALVGAVQRTAHGDDGAGIDALTYDGARSLVSRLQDKLDSFEALYCSSKRAV